MFLGNSACELLEDVVVLKQQNQHDVVGLYNNNDKYSPMINKYSYRSSL